MSLEKNSNSNLQKNPRAGGKLEKKKKNKKKTAATGNDTRHPTNTPGIKHKRAKTRPKAAHYVLL